MTNTKNPIKLLRETADVSVRQLAEQASFSPSVIQALEYGWYPTMSAAQKDAIRVMCEANGVDAAEILKAGYGTTLLGQAYNFWQVAEREAAADKISSKPDARRADSPFQTWRVRSAGAPMKAFCTLMCLPPATITRYETGETKNMPSVLVEALIDANYPHTHLLADLQTKWVAKHVLGSRNGQ